MLKAHDIGILIDILTIHQSRHTPDFNKRELKHSLKDAKIGYRYIKELGELRQTSKHSINAGWRNASFQVIIWQTESFEIGLEKLLKIARKKRSFLMCARRSSLALPSKLSRRRSDYTKIPDFSYSKQENSQSPIQRPLFYKLRLERSFIQSKKQNNLNFFFY
ncbi:MAG: DUF488 domain-containing protein [Candidatus Protochlamydia sp.]|nr:DUF488 domain-containing protein [Candidatus Protochlamydia sp.]